MHYIPLSFVSGAVQPLSNGLFKQTTGPRLLKWSALFLEPRKRYKHSGEKDNKRKREERERGHNEGGLNCVSLREEVTIGFIKFTNVCSVPSLVLTGAS